MSKVLTEAEFSTAITDDRTWRLKEISDLKSAIKRADPALCRVLLRSLVAICYAHWEGYVRFSARTYMDYIARRRLQYSELNSQFFRNHFLPRLAALSTTKTSLHERSRLVEAILGEASSRFSKANDDLIDTKSNLNSKVISEVCLVCALSDEYFIQRSTFIDIVLLKRRNSVAHGEDTLVRFEDLDDITNGTIGLMRAFGDALENQIALKAYRSA